MITITTDIGTITLSKSVIGNIVMAVIESFEGKVTLSDPKGRVHKLPFKLGTKDEINSIAIEENENSIDLRVFVILRLGTSIKQTTGQIIDELRSKIGEATGIHVDTVSVVITGMSTKNHIAARHIEVTG